MHSERDSTRNPVETFYTFGEGPSAVSGNTFDVSDSGVGLVSDKELAEGLVSTLTIPERNITAKAKVCWCTPDGKGFKVGVRLEG
ncbi:MAG: PilZ domain-containing protein [Deltaproteobacteria bacterium]|nr:PilZ domain-containing protein [Deltaproteobacteria bacterium]